MRTIFVAIMLVVATAAAFVLYSLVLDTDKYSSGWSGFRSKNLMALTCTVFAMMYFIVSKQFMVLWYQVPSSAALRAMYERLVFPTLALLLPLVNRSMHIGTEHRSIAVVFAVVVTGACLTDPWNLVRTYVAESSLSSATHNRMFVLRVPPVSFSDVLPFFVALHLMPIFFFLF